VELTPWTHVIVNRRGYRHHGVYVGSGRVIHYAGKIRYPQGLIEEVSLSEFVGGRTVRIARIPDEGVDAVCRARSRLGERCYDLFRNNCEHFCNWCLVGEQRSPQIESLTSSLPLPIRTLERLASFIMALMWAATSSFRAVRVFAGIVANLRSLHRVESECSLLNRNYL
jgi:hypothetical protein